MRRWEWIPRKKTRISISRINIVNLVYASYSRAKDGAERRSLREMINIQGQYQQQGMMAGSGGGVTVNANQQKQRGLLNPMRYIGGKYV